MLIAIYSWNHMRSIADRRFVVLLAAQAQS